MKIEVRADADAVAARGRFALAVSGGHTPWIMLRALGSEERPWENVHVFQVDERVAPAGDAERNLTHLRESLLEQAPLPPRQIYATPVEEDDLESAAASYARTLQHTAGSPPVLDLAYLGLGSDGHTASLVPGDPVLEIPDRDVALTGVYQKRLRMTLTYPMLNRSRRILWLVTGEEKSEMLPRLRAADASIPAGRISRSQALLLATQRTQQEAHGGRRHLRAGRKVRQASPRRQCVRLRALGRHPLGEFSDRTGQPARASSSRPAASIWSARTQAQRSWRACWLCSSPMTSQSSPP